MKSIKLLDGYAFNLAQKFAVSNEYITGIMYHQEIAVFRANLLTGSIEPESLDERRNRILVNMIKVNLERLMTGFPNVHLTEAVLSQHNSVAKEPRPTIQALIRVELHDDQGRLWQGELRDDMRLS